MKRLFVAGGGTGGHLVPGLALAERAIERFPGLRVTFFRTSRPIEARVFAGAHVEIEARELDLSPPGRSLPSWVRFIRACHSAQALVREEIRRDRPDALVALGGYPSLPGIIAALRERVPLVLLEQNCVPGRVVRLLWQRAALLSCPAQALSKLPGAGRGRPLVAATGVPLRSAVVKAAAERRLSPAAPPEALRTVLVVGGSQGARGLNRAIREALPALAKFRNRISWIHVAGDADKEDMAEAYRKGGWESRVLGYAPDLPALLARADLVIARSGGTTVSELTAIGVPAALVPYPHHRDRHQLLNALPLVEAGAARLIHEEKLGPESMTRLFEEVLFDPARLRAMEAAARALGSLEATDGVLDLILRVVGRYEQVGR